VSNKVGDRAGDKLRDLAGYKVGDKVGDIVGDKVRDKLGDKVPRFPEPWACMGERRSRDTTPLLPTN
jgi:hypothetical protein